MWDYPRPPRVERTTNVAVVSLGGVTVAESGAPLRVLETSHPPVFYLPPADVDPACLVPADRSSWCEFKGEATYFSVVAGGRQARDAAWTYRRPLPGFEELRDHVAFYPALVECRLDGEVVQPQPGGFYGGWVTSRGVGPFKGGPGTWGW